MRLAQLALIALVLAGPSSAAARAWKGINPGVSAQAEVVKRFGEPTARTKRGGRIVLAYFGEQALEGTKQAQFHLDASGTVLEITIFLADVADFGRVNEVYGQHFPSDPPAPSTIQAGALPKPEFKVEIEAIAAR